MRLGETWVSSISANSRSTCSCRGGQPLGHLDGDLHVQVAAAAVARVGHAPAPQRENLAGLRARRHWSVPRGRPAWAPRSPLQGRLGIGDRHLADQVLALAVEQFVLLHVDDAIAIARRTARALGSPSPCSRSSVPVSTPAGISTFGRRCRPQSLAATVAAAWRMTVPLPRQEGQGVCMEKIPADCTTAPGRRNKSSFPVECLAWLPSRRRSGISYAFGTARLSPCRERLPTGPGRRDNEYRHPCGRGGLARGRRNRRRIPSPRMSPNAWKISPRSWNCGAPPPASPAWP